MRRIETWEALTGSDCRWIVYSIGNFDGLHLGHRAVLGAGAELARANGACFCVLTFSSNTRQVLYPDAPALRLMLPGRREAGIAAAGADFFAEIPFTREIAALEPEAFLGGLCRNREWVGVVVGDDFAFGRDRHGNVATLASYFSNNSGTALIIPQFEIEGERVSSSLIREQILGGRVEAASRLLGRVYDVEGFREKGNALGRDLGYPTVNLGGITTMLPGDGVYATRVDIPEQTGLPGMTYIGSRPTINGVRRVMETNILGMSLSVPVGTPVRVFFHRFLRGDRKFRDLDTLREQLRLDEDSSRLALDSG